MRSQTQTKNIQRFKITCYVKKEKEKKKIQEINSIIKLWVKKPA